LDVGAGADAAGLCFLTRVPAAHVTAIEIDEKQCALASENAARNGFAGRFETISADVTAPAEVLAKAGFVREAYDHVMANPPFHLRGSVRETPDPSRLTAHVIERGALERWVRFLVTASAPKGTVTLIHRAERLGQLLELLKHRFGDLAVYPLFPKAGEPAGRVIVRGRKNKGRKNKSGGMRLLPGLVLHHADGAYTEEAEQVLRHGKALSLATKKGRRPGGEDGSPGVPEREGGSRARKDA